MQMQLQIIFNWNDFRLKIASKCQWKWVWNDERTAASPMFVDDTKVLLEFAYNRNAYQSIMSQYWIMLENEYEHDVYVNI